MTPALLTNKLKKKYTLRATNLITISMLAFPKIDRNDAVDYVFGFMSICAFVCVKQLSARTDCYQ